MSKLIMSQQEILKGMGLYSGPIDGAWGLQSQSAMAGFQQTASFAGLKPRLGNAYFSPFEDLPKGWSWDASGCVTTSGVPTPQPSPVVAPAPVVVPEPVTLVAADINNDGYVDVLEKEVAEEAAAPVTPEVDADINNDGYVDVLEKEVAEEAK